MRWSLIVAALAFVALAGACGGEEQVTGGLVDPGDLRGRTVGVASLSDPATLELRYLLQQSYALGSGVAVTIMESPAQSLPAQLLDGDIDAAIMTSLSAFHLRDDEAYRVLSHVTKEVRELTGRSILSSILVTYPELAEQKRDALIELNRMLVESLIYFKANQDDVIEAVAADQEAETEYLRWWWDRHDLLLGDLSLEVQGELLDLWQAAMAVGDIDGYPELSDVLFSAEGGEQQEALSEGDRTTLSLALLDDPNRRAALYALEQGILTSDTVDLDVTYLSTSAIVEAASARQHDVIEAMPLAVPLGGAADLEFVVLSGALQNMDGTLLYVRDR